MAELLIMYAERPAGDGTYRRWDVVNTYPDGRIIEQPAPLSASQPFVVIKSPGLDFEESRKLVEPQIIGYDPETGDPIYGARRAWELEGQRLPKITRDLLASERWAVLRWEELQQYVKIKAGSMNPVRGA